ncbi:MAG TPA: hypothetical protein VHM02_12435 [Thermoanaerobaculia bacterium]|nr:hypothetical protein [Thermoanaerobaculia bacterium]
MAVCLAWLLAVPGAAAEESSSEPAAAGAADMFRQADRLFAVGAASGGAGSGVEPGGGEDLQPRPGGEVFEDSRCAMESGTCDGTCIFHLSYYCSTSTCSKFDFCP